MNEQPYTQDDFTRNPLMLYYEVTQACDLVCKHCRASAQEAPASDELTTPESLALLGEVLKFPRTPTLCFTGGDPLKRVDLFDLITEATRLGIRTALTPSATPLATERAFERAKRAGVSAIGISLDGPDALLHDAFRGFSGSFDKTLEMLNHARHLNLPVQVNTSITRRNVNRIDEIAVLLEKQGIAMWSVFFLVPVGRGLQEERIRPDEYRTVFEKLYRWSNMMPFSIKTTEAPHYRRYVLEQGGDPLAAPQKVVPAKTIAENGVEIQVEANTNPLHLRHRAPLGITDGRGIMFIGHNGELFPAGFLPIVCGRFPNDSLVDVYQNHPLFRSLQNPDEYRGICGSCDSRFICGGSRARAYAVTGDPLGPEPDCFFE